MAPCNINVLISTFHGLSLPPTLCLPLPSTTTTDGLLTHLTDRFPQLPPSTRLIISTTAGRQITHYPSTTPLQSIVSTTTHNATCILPLHLSAPLAGGKGGFGSQLRAAGGRMSSRKKKQNAALATGSARNLDGRRLRTIAEAKNLAAYLATKPDADAREREEKRRRWEGIVEMAEQREAEMRSGKGKDGRRRGLGEDWMETKEEVGENVKSAVQKAMAAQSKEAGSDSGSGGSAEASDVESDAGQGEEDVMELDEEGMEKLRVEAEAGDEDAMWVLKERLKIPERYLPEVKKPKMPQRRFVGFDDDEDISSSEEDEEASGAKDKAKAIVD
ncbi:uncharacterized protein HMPREF1541_02656 [Cyphellophora europaea CBS 101466]|uniref:Uncharacterized protein n=1 Tax=Cyphellophora europaea (strain CBS 101466) TaxID=1220924 RepID=W2S487_CYPE1|nr:uncharacterized protein HMPREF1541_02656 [Cyphellophora europaea CBS 101466]ETN43497.1 hypothetical protein HMPREF1541_02656 [Cyphellophora europaea CBS 101466]